MNKSVQFLEYNALISLIIINQYDLEKDKSQNFALQIGLELMMDRDPSPKKPCDDRETPIRGLLHPPRASSAHVRAPPIL